MVAAGESITFTAKGTTGAYLPRSVDSVRQVAIDNLTPYFDVVSVSIDTDTFLQDPLHYLSNWPYSATLRLVTRDAYGGIRDADSIVAHAFYEATGELPTVTAQYYEQDQGEPDAKHGFPLWLVAVLAVVALVAVATLKVAD